MLEPLSGGTTRPWTALVDDGGELPGVYVVKPFSAHDLGQANYLAAEVMGSVLCGEFDIATPDFCLVTFEALEGLNCPVEFSKRLAEKQYPQPWFASRSAMPHAEFTASLLKSHLPKDEMALLLAFDCLIMNNDRVKRKPNLLIKDKHVLAIDHERAFAAHRPASADCSHIAKGHLLFRRVREAHRSKGRQVFDTFQEYLRMLDLRAWHASLDRLEQLERPFVHRSAWEKYLLLQKADPGRLITSLSLLLK